MKEPRISVVVAVDKNRGIGKNNEIPWNIPDDRKKFKEITMGHPVIMGRKTFESIIYKYIHKPLPGRTNIVITRDPDYQVEGGVVVHSLDEAIEKAKAIDHNEIFIIGGSQIFEQGLPLVKRLYLTVVEGDYEADTYFPDYSEYKKVIQKRIYNSNSPKYTFFILERS